MLKKKSKVFTPEQIEEIRTKDFFDMILPSTVKFLSDHYILGDSYRCVWVIREYPPSTEEQAILSQLADRSGVTLRIYHRLVESMEQRKIIQNATRRNKLKSGGNDVNETIEAEGNLQDVVELLANLRKNREPLLHCSVFIELKAKSMDGLKELQSDIAMELTRSKISVDRLTLRQKEGFLSVLPVGANQFGAQYERVLPASSVANLYPFNFSGKTDPQGLYIGRDKFGTNILADFDRRAEDKTTSNILILGNSGQGKSYLLKLILTNIRESGKENAMNNGNDAVRTGIYISRSLLKRCDENISKTDAASRSEFISDAVEMYIAWLNSKESSKMLTPALESVIGAKIADTESRLARLLFKLSVEMAMVMNVLAASNDIDKESINRLRGECIKEVKRLNGRFSFENAVDWQSD